MALHGHAERVADHDGVESGTVKQVCETVVIGGEAGNLLTGLLQLAQAW